MYEVVKVVNGHEIFRMVGTHGCYHVITKRFASGTHAEVTFNTIKAAKAFIEANF